MGRIQEKVSAALAAEVEGRTEWDEAPGLYFLYLRGGGGACSEAGPAA
jgi:hypothetical protein